jgi:hypothetical protein
MGHWYVVNNFGSIVAGPFISRDMAESFAGGSGFYSVVYQ